MDKLYIVMPAYNEEANIEKTIEEWYPVVSQVGNGSKLVIVDDGSKDTTYKTMERLQSGFPDFVPLTKPNSGHGATCLYAYRYALENQSDYVFQTDSDGKHAHLNFGQCGRIGIIMILLLGRGLDGKMDSVELLLLKFCV